MKRALTLTMVVLLHSGCGGKSAPEQAPPPDNTAAVSTVSGAQLKGTAMRLDELLRGRAAGLDVVTGEDGVTRLRIRGMGSINGDPEPLVLVNNIEVPVSRLENALAGMTREDIKEVRVLKDVASTSVYGMRGAGGVILITTKR